MANPFVMYDNIVPLVAPQDITTNITASPYMDLKYAHKAAFLVFIGNLASGTATDREEITVEAVSTPTGSEAAIAFNYRISGAVGANTWGAVTARSATQVVSLDPAADDNKAIWIEIDPDALAAAGHRYVRVKATDNPDMANCLISVVGLLTPRYKQTTHLSSTAAASA